MTLQLELSPELEARLVHEAQARGMKPEEYAQTVLDQSVPLEPGKHRDRLNGEEFLRAMAEGSERLPHLPNEAFSRESIYKDHP
jgi:hypothetical protein